MQRLRDPTTSLVTVRHSDWKDILEGKRVYIEQAGCPFRAQMNESTQPATGNGLWKQAERRLEGNRRPLRSSVIPQGPCKGGISLRHKTAIMNSAASDSVLFMFGFRSKATLFGMKNFKDDN